MGDGSPAVWTECEWLASDSDIFIQLCNVQASVLWERKRAAQALCNGVVSVLEGSDLQVYSVDEPEP